MDVSVGRVAALGSVFGFCLALGWMGAYAARTAWTVTSGGRWYQVKELAGVGPVKLKVGS